MKKLQTLFGGCNLTWPKLILFAVAAGAYTALMAIIPALHYTSFITVTATLEVWILFGILIILNSKSNKDAALKCFVFFLISQPLVYLLQVPFSWQGWKLFQYYPYWFIWTVLCLPMGFVGYYMKKDKWWGYLILLPMILLTGYSYLTYFPDFQFASPRYLLIVLFCAAAMILYPVLIFHNRKIRIVGAAVGIALTAVLTVICLLNPPVYSRDILFSGEEAPFDETCQVSLADSRCGDVCVRYEPDLETCVVHADFRHAGKTVMTLELPDGSKLEYDVTVERTTYRVRKK